MTQPRPRELRRLDQARYRAGVRAKAQAIRDRYADYDPPDVRSYGEPYDSIIAAAAVSSVPYPESPNRGVKG